MKKGILVTGIALAATLVACDSNIEKQQIGNIPYPFIETVDTVDTYFGTAVADPYRWLEDDHSEETGEWVAAQNEVTNSFLEQIPYRDQIKKRLTEIWNYPKSGAPFKRGDKYYVYRNDGLQNQYVVYVMDEISGEEKVFIDPNNWSEDGTASLSGLRFSLDGRYAAYAISESGSDWRRIKIIDVEKGQELEDEVNWVKFSGISWAGKGFFYSAYDAPQEDEKLKGKNEYHKVYFHQLGDAQSQDELVYQDKENPLRNFYAGTTDDERFVYIGGSEGTSGNNLMIKDLRKPSSKFVTVVDDFKKDHNVVGNVGEEILILTTLKAPNKRLVKVKLQNPAKWEDVIAEKEQLLEDAKLAGGKMFVTYMQDAASKVYQYSQEGKLENEIELPGIGTASGFNGKEEDTELFYTFTSFTFPSNIYKYDINTGESSLYEASQVNFDPEEYETKQVFYTSKDGTEVPMFIVHKKGLKLDGSNPTLLYSYGGFDISMTPNFSPARLAWLEKGGIYAQPSIRGGGEYGQAWHEGGMKFNKQNVFDDFIAAAEYLIEENYTSSKKLAISGRSNGGLLIGASMTQRPELFKVALPAVGVLDMLRYHRFTIGWAWAVEYGSAEDNEEMFSYLHGYSPLHNVKEGVQYPATLVTTADHDDRVVPAHSFKFISELQTKGAPGNPYMIRVETKAGHGAGKPTSKVIEEWADKYAFTWYNMGVEPKKIEEQEIERM